MSHDRTLGKLDLEPKALKNDNVSFLDYLDGLASDATGQDEPDEPDADEGPERSGCGGKNGCGHG